MVELYKLGCLPIGYTKIDGVVDFGASVRAAEESLI